MNSEAHRTTFQAPFVPKAARWRPGPLAVLSVATLATSCNAPLGTPNNPLPAENLRVAIQSQCAQNVIRCTTSFPDAIVSVEALGGQTVTATDAGFLIVEPGLFGSAHVKLIGSGSTAGEGQTNIHFRWTFGASDQDPCSLESGPEFSTEADPIVRMAQGVHYIRLTVTNDIIRDVVESEACGIIGENIPNLDFVEVEIEVRSR